MTLYISTGDGAVDYRTVEFYRAVLDIANPIDPIDRSIRILNQVVAMERDEALHRPR